MLLIRTLQAGGVLIEGTGSVDREPDLRELFVTPQQSARDGGHRVLRPELRRRQMKLLRADRTHLFAHDGADLEQRPLCQEQVTVDSGRELADIAGTLQERVVGAQRGNE